MLVKNNTCAYKEPYPGASQQNIANCFPIYKVNPSVIWCAAGNISREEKKQDNGTCESV